MPRVQHAVSLGAANADAVMGQIYNICKPDAAGSNAMPGDTVYTQSRHTDSFRYHIYPSGCTCVFASSGGGTPHTRPLLAGDRAQCRGLPPPLRLLLSCLTHRPVARHREHTHTHSHLSRGPTGTCNTHTHSHLARWAHRVSCQGATARSLPCPAIPPKGLRMKVASQGLVTEGRPRGRAPPADVVAPTIRFRP